MINTSDFLRYNRQMAMEEVGILGQTKIKQARVLVIGAGGLGCPVALYLAASGVGTLGIVDFDTIEIHNLHRQILYHEKDVNRYKTTVATERLKTVNPHITIRTHNEKLTAENIASILINYDYIVDGSDNFSTRYLVNDSCVHLSKTLIYGSILGFEGQLAVFNHQGSKDLRALFPAAPDPKLVPNCSLNGVLGTFTGIIGTMMAHETLKVILDLPHLNNELLLIDTKNWIWSKLRF
ncbi:HesA/MoeB/ThiF family protein [Flavobacterium sp. NKUCC04_CG]|uniref:HesA/MoeB/ThiF family protein n=1 Tax=Flavobacterium sp. NKUCC04_CG TaxID=2842121 RepID=UPI001C5AE487|nr:HesA/MoeB/ThiF family protein [Flavobacterium sp. NKUCC04_CG]MBW3518589.1 HesA/MoeB/ThiF family protein [Flavobacterium sp. NKUCC04_CG]